MGVAYNQTENSIERKLAHGATVPSMKYALPFICIRRTASI